MTDRVFFPVPEAAARWQRHMADIGEWAADGRLRIFMLSAPIATSAGELDGFLQVHPAEIISICGRYCPAPSAQIRRVRPRDGVEWIAIEEPSGAVTITPTSLIILADELDEFERQNRLGPYCGSVSSEKNWEAGKYDWDKFYCELAARIHEEGLPESQNKMLRQMQEWWAMQDADGGPGETTLLRRIRPIWQRLRGDY